MNNRDHEVFEPEGAGDIYIDIDASKIIATLVKMSERKT